MSTRKPHNQDAGYIAEKRFRGAHIVKTAFAAAPCSAALTWTVEKPRASGMWWWWNLDPRCAPDMVEVRASDVLSWCGLGPTMHWPGLTRVRNVMTAGGVWAGPVEPPETPSAETPPNASDHPTASGKRG